MPVTVSYPGLYIEEIHSSSHTIAAAPTSITVFVGYTHPFKTNPTLFPDRTSSPQWPKGIPGKPVRIFSFTEYVRHFGGFFESDFINPDLPYAVEQFFLNGGADAYVVPLQARYFDPVAKTQQGDVAPATLAIPTTNITFTAREPTDADHVMTVTIIPKVTTDASTNTLADITISLGSQTETFRKVSLNKADKANFIETRLGTPGNERSSLVTVSKTVAASDYGPTYPAPISNFPLVLPTAPQPTWTTFQPQDYIDNFQAETPLDKVDIFNLMVLPGVADTPIWSEAVSFCESKFAFLIMDPPRNYSADGLNNLPLIEDFKTGGAVPPSRNAALYFPYLKSFTQGGDPVSLAPGGFVAGIFARTDNNRGVWKAPAGLETTILNTTGVEDPGRMTDRKHGVLNLLGVNVIRQFTTGTVVFGAHTVVYGNPSFEQWKYVPVRRMALFLEQTLLRNLGWVVFEPNDEPLWLAIRTSIEAFMLGLFRQQAFQGSSPSDAFRVTCDKTTTTSADQDNGIVNIVVAFAPLKPAEFVVIQIAQLAGQTQS